MADIPINPARTDDPPEPDTSRADAPEDRGAAPELGSALDSHDARQKPDAEAPAEATDEAQDRIAQLEAEAAEMKDRMLRALAEAENTRRRAARDREEAEKYGGVRLARDLLAVHDNLDRALAAADETVRTNAPDFIAGVELTQRELLNAFAKHQIAPVAPELGERFDPNRHQAMFEAEVPGAEAGTIIQVMQTGFTISDRLLRAAMVGVAKGGAGAKPTEDPSPAAETSGEGAGEEKSAETTAEAPDDTQKS